MLETVEIKAQEIFQSGVWNNDHYSNADLDAMVQAFTELPYRPPIKLGHAAGQEKLAEEKYRNIFGAPSLGFVSRLYRAGSKLLADFSEVPRRLGELIKKKAYSRISAEVYFDLVDETLKKKFSRALKAVAFLGSDIPAIGSLKDIEALYLNRAGNNIHVATFQTQEGRITMEHTEPNEGKQVSMSEASFALTEHIHSYAREHKIDFRTAAQRVFAETSQGAGATQQLGALISDAVAAGKMELAIEIASSDPQLARNCASEWIANEANKAIANETGMQSAHLSEGVAIVIRNNPEVAIMQSSGVVSEQAIKAIFLQWFK